MSSKILALINCRVKVSMRIGSKLDDRPVQNPLGTRRRASRPPSHRGTRPRSRPRARGPCSRPSSPLTSVKAAHRIPREEPPWQHVLDVACEHEREVRRRLTSTQRLTGDDGREKRPTPRNLVVSLAWLFEDVVQPTPRRALRQRQHSGAGRREGLIYPLDVPQPERRVSRAVDARTFEARVRVLTSQRVLPSVKRRDAH